MIKVYERCEQDASFQSSTQLENNSLKKLMEKRQQTALH